MKIDALQNQQIFMLGCTVEGSHLKALLAFTKPSAVVGLAGQPVVLVEPHRANDTIITAIMPEDLEPLYTYLDLELINCDSNLMGN